MRAIYEKQLSVCPKCGRTLASPGAECLNCASKKKLVGKGGAVAYFGTNDIREVAARAQAGDRECEVFLKGFAVSVAKYIASLAVVVDGKVDAIVLTGGIANSKAITDDIARRVEFIAPVEVYPGENELESLAENGYGILSGEFEIGTYHRDRF